MKWCVTDEKTLLFRARLGASSRKPAERVEGSAQHLTRGTQSSVRDNNQRPVKTDDAPRRHYAELAQLNGAFGTGPSPYQHQRTALHPARAPLIFIASNFGRISDLAAIPALA